MSLFKIEICFLPGLQRCLRPIELHAAPLCLSFAVRVELQVNYDIGVINHLYLVVVFALKLIDKHTHNLVLIAFD